MSISGVLEFLPLLICMQTTNSGCNNKDLPYMIMLVN